MNLLLHYDLLENNPIVIKILMVFQLSAPILLLLGVLTYTTRAVSCVVCNGMVIAGSVVQILI